MDFSGADVAAELAKVLPGHSGSQGEVGDNLFLAKRGWDGLHVIVMPKGYAGPIPSMPDYLAPRRMDFRFRPYDVRLDRRLETQDGARGVTGVHLHMQVTSQRTNFRMGWASRSFRYPMQTLEALFRRAAAIPLRLEDSLAYIAEGGFAGIRMHHHLEGDWWEHYLDWDNRENLAELPDDARRFLTLIFGGVPIEMEVGFRSNASYALQAARGELTQAFLALHNEALKAEAMLRFLHEKVAGRNKLELNPWDWEV